MSEPIKHTCCKKLYVGEYSMTTYECGKTAKVERDGKHYCGTHDPVAIKARDDKRSMVFRQKYEAECDYRRKNAESAAEQKRRADCYDDLFHNLRDIDRRLRECISLGLSAAEAYDSFYSENVQEAIARATGATP